MMKEKRKRKNEQAKNPVQPWFKKSAWIMGPIWMFICAGGPIGGIIGGIWLLIMISDTFALWNPKKGIILAIVLLMPVFYFLIFMVMMILGDVH